MKKQIKPFLQLYPSTVSLTILLVHVYTVVNIKYKFLSVCCCNMFYQLLIPIVIFVLMSLCSNLPYVIDTEDTFVVRPHLISF